MSDYALERARLQKDLAETKQWLKAAVTALRGAQETIHSEWCGHNYHAEPCREVTDALRLLPPAEEL